MKIEQTKDGYWLADGRYNDREVLSTGHTPKEAFTLWCLWVSELVPKPEKLTVYVWRDKHGTLHASEVDGSDPAANIEVHDIELRGDL